MLTINIYTLSLNVKNIEQQYQYSSISDSKQCDHILA